MTKFSLLALALYVVLIAAALVGFFLLDTPLWW